jgi:hypothetical protein
MHSPAFRVLHVTVALLLLAAPAAGQYTRDDAAGKKIREAIEQYYLPTRFDEAEAMLNATIEACEDKCSPQVLAKAWMYIGVVRGSGRNSLAGAKEAFARAIALDPGVELDSALATATTERAFQDAGGWATTSAKATKPSDTAAPAPPKAAAAAEGAGLECTPKTHEAETRRPVPVQCRAAAGGAASMELRFKPFGEDWQSLKMTAQGDSFRAEIPCDKTRVSGALQLFVRAKDASGDEVAGWGTKADPIQIRLVESSAEAPPKFDDTGPPPRCAAKEDCPPNFPGCGGGSSAHGNVDWGGKCDNSSECKSGLLCLDGACEVAPSCETDANCPAGACVGGKCDIVSRGEPHVTSYAKNWFGLHVAQDLMFVGGSNICTQSAQAGENFSCYYAGSRSGAYVDEPYPGAKKSTTPVLATTRILLSYDRSITANISGGLRVGYAFGGGPPAGRDVIYDRSGRVAQVVDKGLSFLPLHLELRVSYWFGASPLGRKGLRPYVHVGGGLAPVDGKVVLSVKDCGLYATRGTQAYADCANGTVPSNDARLRSVDLDAWKKLGQGFLTVGGGAVYAFTNTLGAQVNLNLMYSLPASGVVIEPSLGATLGF